MKRCPECGIFFSDEEDRCDQDRVELQPTDAIIDRYQIVERLGIGGMGTVYRAVHTLLDNRVVAIKLLHRQLSQYPATVDRFFREARAASRVENRHIVEIIDFGVTPKGDSFLVMEHLDGICLRDLLEEQVRLSLRRALTIGLQIAEALYAVHRKSIVHRDLKPENVMLIQRDGREFVKLLDFGIAKLSEPQAANLTRVGMVIGTPAYMSPEQAGAEAVDLRADVYALGTILYEMLTGRCPFEAETAKQILLAQLTQEPTPPRQLRPEIPVAIERVILHALHKDREQRPQSMFQLACELRDALADGAGQASDPPSGRTDGPASGRPDGGPSSGRPDGPAGGLTSEPTGDALIEPPDPLEPELARGPTILGRLSRFARTPRVMRWLGLAGVGAGLLLGIGITLLILRPSGEQMVPPRPVAAAPPSKPDASRPGSPQAGLGESNVRLRDPLPPPAPDLPSSERALAPGLGELASRENAPPAHSRRSHARRPAPPLSLTRASRGGGGGRGGRGGDEPASAWSARLVSRPAGADVYESEQQIGTTPMRVDTSRPRVLVIHLLGHDPQTVRVAAHQHGTITAALKPAAVSWEVSSLRKLKEMRDQGQISKRTYKRRLADLSARREQQLLQLKIQHKTGQLTRAQYERAAKAVEESYR